MRAACQSLLPLQTPCYQRPDGQVATLRSRQHLALIGVRERTLAEAAKVLIAAGGGRADDLDLLVTGEFYFKTEKSGKPVMVRTLICLSYHPANPPMPEEVVARARALRVQSS